MLDLRLENISDDLTRDAVFNIVEAFRQEDILNCKFRHFEIVFPASVSNFKYPHKLGFMPKDVILTSSIGAGTATFNYTLFDNINLNITTSGAVTIRFLAGSFVKESQA